MSDEKFDFISDDEIEKILGKQEEEESVIDEIDSLLTEEGDEDESKMSDDMLEDLLSYKKEDSFDFDADESDREEVSISPMQFREFIEDDEVEIDIAGLELLYDVPVEISVLLGSISLEIGKLSKIGVGTKIPLKKLAGEPVEIYVGDILIAKGETYVIDNENTFGVMITEILSERERILSVYESLKKQKQI